MLKLLIIDDEPIILAGIRDMIEQENTPFTSISVALDGIEALDQMTYFHPDLVITDINMPEMDGLSFIREAQRRNVRRFIVLTGHEKFEYALEAIKLQVIEYLLKPINQQELGTLLRKLALEISSDKITERMNESLVTESPYSSEKMRLLSDFIHANFNRDISLSNVAEKLNLHPAYVGQLFKKETGQSFISFLRDVRMKKAKELLLQMPELSMEQIARCVGYENSRTFYKVFREQFGQSPGEFREANLEKK